MAHDEVAPDLWKRGHVVAIVLRAARVPAHLLHDPAPFMPQHCLEVVAAVGASSERAGGGDVPDLSVGFVHGDELIARVGHLGRF